MIQKALEYLVGLGKVEVFEVDGQKYSSKNIARVTLPKAAKLETTTLTSIVDYIRSNFDGKGKTNLLIQVESPNTVSLRSELRNDAEREIFVLSEALLPTIQFDRFVDSERFNIMLQSSFVENEDRAVILRVVGNIKDETVRTTGDDGVSQAVTIKTGVAAAQNVLVPNPVILAPFRTFPEVEQPESKFIFRMKTGHDGPECGLFIADGGAWRNEAMESIKAYFRMNLEDMPNIKIIS